MSKLTLALLAAVVLVSGCVSPESIIRANPVVSEFMNKYPNSEVKVTYFTKQQAENFIANLREACGNPYLEAKNYYAINIENEESDLSVVAWVDWDSQTVVCAIKQGVEKSPEEPTQETSRTENRTEEAPSLPSETPYVPATAEPVMTPEEPVKPSCSTCDDSNKCTFDYCNQYTSYECRHKSVEPCYNNGVCEYEETALPEAPSCPNLGWVAPSRPVKASQALPVVTQSSSQSVSAPVTATTTQPASRIAEQGYDDYVSRTNSGHNSDCPATCDDGNANTSDYYDLQAQQCKHYNCYATATPTPVVEFCGWCGTSCTRIKASTMCPQVMPPEGYDCQEISGACVKVSVQTPTPAATPASTPTPTKTPTPAAATPTPIPDTCGGYSTCSVCTNVLQCGWCISSGTCKTGSFTSSSDGTCTGTDWAWVSDECSTPTPAPTLTPTPTRTPTPLSTPVNTPTPTPQPSYPRWEQVNVTFSPEFLGGNGGSLEASIATQESGSPSIINVTFTLEKPDGTTETKTATSTCAVAGHPTYTSKCWKVTFNIPENNETDVKNYKVTASNPYISGTPFGALGVPSSFVFPM